MRKRSRDIQIFSLSMMDVISGAMGAFLIVMIILMRYYKTDQEIAQQSAEVQQHLQDVQRQIDEAVGLLEMTTNVDVEELLRKLKAAQEQLEQVKREVVRLANDLAAARARVSRLESRNYQLEAENLRLTRELQDARARERELQGRVDELAKEVKRLEERRPFLVLGKWFAPQAVDVDIVLEDSLSTRSPDTPRFNPDRKESVVWPGDLTYEQANSPGGPLMCSTSTILRRDVPANVNYKVYAVLRGDRYAGPPIEVVVQVLSDGMDTFEQTVGVSRRRRWMLAAVLSSDGEGRLTARPPTGDEIREDLREVELRMRNARSPAASRPEGR